MQHAPRLPCGVASFLLSYIVLRDDEPRLLILGNMWNPCWSTIALLSVAILSAGQLQSPLDPGTSPLLYWSSDLGSAAVPRSSRVVYEV